MRWRLLCAVSQPCRTPSSRWRCARHRTPRPPRRAACARGRFSDGLAVAPQDKLDELRAASPRHGSTSLRKFLHETGGDVSAAIAKAKEAADSGLKHML